MSHISFDYSGLPEKLYPFTETRNLLDIRVGILTLREKWQLFLPGFMNGEESPDDIRISANVLPSRQLAD
jgi:hypothetical protein